MHIWLIFFYYIACISGSLITFVPFWSEKHFWHSLKMKFRMNVKHLSPFASQQGQLSVGGLAALFPYGLVLQDCNYSKSFYFVTTTTKKDIVSWESCFVPYFCYSCIFDSDFLIIVNYKWFIRMFKAPQKCLNNSWLLLHCSALKYYAHLKTKE